MKNLFLLLLTSVMLITSCEKDEYFSLSDSVAADSIALTAGNAVYYERIPYVTTSQSGDGTFQITWELSPNSRKNIKEISRVAVGTIGATAGPVNTGNNASSVQRTTGLYNLNGTTIVPIPGSGKKVTFASNLAEFRSKYPAARFQINPDYVSGRTPSELFFYFLITFDDGTTTIPTESRVRILR
jgi:hypothetical protein